MNIPWSTPVPYCGAPPIPGALLLRWNLDPVLIAVLLAGLVLVLIGKQRVERKQGRSAAWRGRLFCAGWLTLTLALISPLCPLSVSLFSARVSQHMIISLIAAPLILLGRPGVCLAALWPNATRQLSAGSFLSRLRGAGGSAAVFTAAMWFWHAPGPYDATFASPIVYWLMHVTVFAAALMVWNVLLDPSRAPAPPVLALGAISTLQMTFLGALITLTPRMLYAPHILTPYAWGLTQASDQQLGGLIMWVPGCSIFLAVTLFTLARVMSERVRPDALA
jgi:putative membrane protein